MGINSGVPQGSVLGPQLFNLYINDITKLPIAKSLLFADDAVFYITDDDWDECIKKLNEFLGYLSGWLMNNKLTPNTGKTYLMVFTCKF